MVDKLYLNKAVKKKSQIISFLVSKPPIKKCSVSLALNETGLVISFSQKNVTDITVHESWFYGYRYLANFHSFFWNPTTAMRVSLGQPYQVKKKHG